MREDGDAAPDPSGEPGGWQSRRRGGSGRRGRRVRGIPPRDEEEPPDSARGDDVPFGAPFHEAPVDGEHEGERDAGTSRRRTGRRGRSAEEGGERSRDPEEAARALCLRLLTGTPRTRRQLEQAMQRRGIPDEVAEHVLSRFEDVGLIDDAAFANAWVESRHHSRGLARRALARELRTRGVQGDLVEEAVGQLDPEQEAVTARHLVDRKLHATRGLDRDKRVRRLAGMLARKGYGEALALRVVRQALEEEGEDAAFLERYLPE